MKKRYYEKILVKTSIGRSIATSFTAAFYSFPYVLEEVISSIDTPREIWGDKVYEYDKLEYQEDHGTNPTVLENSEYKDHDQDNEPGASDKVPRPLPTEKLVNEEFFHTSLDTEGDQDAEHSKIEHNGGFGRGYDQEGEHEEGDHNEEAADWEYYGEPFVILTIFLRLFYFRWCRVGHTWDFATDGSH